MQGISTTRISAISTLLSVAWSQTS